MKKNFNSISQFKVPQEWIDGALNVQKPPKKEKPIFFIKHMRTIGAVACTVIVLALSIFMVLMRDDNLHVKPDNPDIESKSSSEYDEKIPPTTKDGRVIETNSGYGYVYETTVDGRLVIIPTEKGSIIGPTRPVETEPKETLKPDFKPSLPDAPTEVTEPTEETKESGSESTEDPIPPIDESTEATEGPPPSIDESTEESMEDWSEESSVESTEESFGPIVTPTISPDLEVSVDVTFSKNLLGKYSLVFCKIVTPSGYVISNGNLYSSQHSADIVQISGNTVYANYSPSPHGITSPGYYTFVFYNENGTTMAQVRKFIG